MERRALLLSSPQLRSFRRALLGWYEGNHRDLPWRRDHDPYRVWVSEIMLQQTRVAAVLEYYARFMRRFPTVQSLACARESSVLAMWSGLGYYHRARRMHQAAKVIARDRKGALPHDAEGWSELPGIGRYTAAAIASIAFGEAVAVVDGNVERVLQRLTGDAASRDVTWQEAELLLDHKRPGDFNQAMMELGATICTPRTPKCMLCPVNGFCKTRGMEQAAPGAPRKREELAYALVCRRSLVLLIQRPSEAARMAGMWELPMLSAAQLNGDGPLLRLRHSITDTDYRVAVYAMSPDLMGSRLPNTRWFSRPQFTRLPLTGLTRKILRRLALASSAAVPVSK